MDEINEKLKEIANRILPYMKEVEWNKIEISENAPKDVKRIIRGIEKKSIFSKELTHAMLYHLLNAMAAAKDDDEMRKVIGCDDTKLIDVILTTDEQTRDIVIKQLFEKEKSFLYWFFLHYYFKVDTPIIVKDAMIETCKTVLKWGYVAYSMMLILLVAKRRAKKHE